MYLHKVHGFFKEFFYFLSFVLFYTQKKLRIGGLKIETVKGVFIQAVLAKRGKYKRPFLHVGMMGLLGIGVVIGPFLATSYPLISAESDLSQVESLSETPLSITDTEGIFQTQISQKPRDTIITYTVEKGDTISTIAQKFGVSEDTIRWANDLTTDRLTVGDELKILPVSGMSHKVARGDTVYTIAKKYDTEPQQIINFPFNDFADPEVFTLSEGTTIIVPEGIKPKAPVRSPRIAPQLIPDTIAQGSAGFLWPAAGNITQYPVWYHNAVDIANKAAPPVGAAKKGKVMYSGCVRGGYGCHIILSHEGNLETLYAHLQEMYVSLGQEVSQGQLIGKMGSTGRSTGTHLHFEVRKNGAVVSPLPYLQ